MILTSNNINYAKAYITLTTLLANRAVFVYSRFPFGIVRFGHSEFIEWNE